jgi:hypothetical protein
MKPSRQSTRRRVVSSAAALMLVGLVASTTAGADPSRAPAPPPGPTAVPNPQRDPVPPTPVCDVLRDPTNCRNMCLGCEGNCTIHDPAPKGFKGTWPRNPQACDEIGRVYLAESSHYEAFRFFDASCNPAPVGVVGGPVGAVAAIAVAPFWGGCFDLGKQALTSEANPANPTNARALIARACAMAAPTVTYEACFTLGQMAEAGTGGPKDVGAALDAYKRACDGSYPRACQAFLRLEPATRAPSRTPPGTSPSSIPSPPHSVPPRTPAPRPRVQ